LGSAVSMVPSASFKARLRSASRGSAGSARASAASSRTTSAISAGSKTAGASEKLALENAATPSCLANFGSAAARWSMEIESISGLDR
jgi:hypothetical protein